MTASALLSALLLATAPTRVLFVGNSYTYQNDLPGTFARMAEALGAPVEVESIAEGGMDLADHLEEGVVRQRLEERDFDWVVLQEQSTLGVNRFHDGVAVLNDTSAYEDAARALVEAARADGARAALLLTWSRREQAELQPALNRAIAGLARDVGATLVPAGALWRQALEERPELSLYAVDGSHPSATGTYLVATCLVARLLGRDVTELDAPSGAVTPEDAVFVRSLVARALGPDGSRTRALPERAAPPVVLEPPRGETVELADLAGVWSGDVRLIPDSAPSRLELSVDPAAEEPIELHLLHDEPSALFPDPDAHPRPTFAQGSVRLEHDSPGFGTRYVYALALEEGRLRGWMRIDSGERTYFSATLDLVRAP